MYARLVACRVRIEEINEPEIRNECDNSALKEMVRLWCAGVLSLQALSMGACAVHLDDFRFLNFRPDQTSQE